MKTQPEKLDPEQFYIARPWTRNEDIRLRAAILRGLPASRIAEGLGRTVMSVRTHASKLGLTLKRR
jgi:hypothetical protein